MRLFILKKLATQSHVIVVSLHLFIFFVRKFDGQQKEKKRRILINKYRQQVKHNTPKTKSSVRLYALTILRVREIMSNIQYKSISIHKQNLKLRLSD